MDNLNIVSIRELLKSVGEEVKNLRTARNKAYVTWNEINATCEEKKARYADIKAQLATLEAAEEHERQCKAATNARIRARAEARSHFNMLTKPAQELLSLMNQGVGLSYQSCGSTEVFPYLGINVREAGYLLRKHIFTDISFYDHDMAVCFGRKILVELKRMGFVEKPNNQHGYRLTDKASLI
jgi:hypothetical protein